MFSPSVRGSLNCFLATVFFINTFNGFPRFEVNKSQNIMI